MSCDIEDVSVLKYAKSVCLFWCQKIDSVSPLKTVKKVSLINSGKSGFSDLGEVPNLLLTLQDEYELNDETMTSLNNRRLSFTGDSLTVTSLSVFSSLIQHLYIGESEIFAKFINDGQGVLLQHLLSLTLAFSSVVSLEGVGHIPTVRLVECDRLQTMKGLGSNRCVELNNCSSVEDVSSLASVSIVTIKYCPKLTKTSCECLKNVPRLKIVFL